MVMATSIFYVKTKYFVAVRYFKYYIRLRRNIKYLLLHFHSRHCRFVIVIIFIEFLSNSILRIPHIYSQINEKKYKYHRLAEIAINRAYFYDNC